MLELKNISKFYGSRIILRKINARLQKGSLSLVTGANGAGKSTLLRIMAGLTHPDGGEVVCKSTGMGYLGHATFLYADLTALENLRFWARAYGLNPTDAELDYVLDKYGLKFHAGEKTRYFSRGMAQKLNFCRLLIQKPIIMLLDEPFTGLDQDSRELVQNDLAVLKSSGTAIAMIGHDFANDSRLADRIYHLKDHSICELDEAQAKTQAH